MRGLCRAVFALLFLTSHAIAADPELVRPDPQKQLLLDRRTIASTDNARLALGTPVKHPGNPLFQADKPWENALNNLYPNVCWDPSEKLFKLWYKDVLADKDAIARMDGPSTVHDVGWYLLYATSKDGIAWEKPRLGLHAFGGDKATNIVARDTPNVGVFRDEHDNDASRRYKMIYDVGLGKPRVRFSADGIHWADPIDAEGFGPRNGDTHNNAFFDERLGKYVAFTKLYLGERLVARFESDDFIRWKPSDMVLRSTVEEGRASQTYCMPVFRYANVYLGYVMMYNVGRDRSVDCEFAWSPDGIAWERIAPGTPFLPRGPKGSFDSMCIYAQAGQPVMKDGRLLMYYGGSDFPHTGWKRHCVPALATLRPDGFAGYAAIDSAKPATITLSPMKMGQPGLTVSTDIAEGGAILVQLLNDDGILLVSSHPITRSGTDIAVTWQPPGFAWRHMIGQRATIRLIAQNATVYALGGAELINTSLPPRTLAAVPAVDAAKTPTYRFSFDGGAEQWSGVDKIAHVATGGQAGGFVTVSRAGTLRPIASSSPDPAKSAIARSWFDAFGGNPVQVRFAARSQQAGGRITFEIFAKDISQWSYSPPGELATDWKTFIIPLRPDWTDEQAKAAGWKPAAHAFSWRETMTHVGKLTILPAGGSGSFDLDEVEIRTAK